MPSSVSRLGARSLRGEVGAEVVRGLGRLSSWPEVTEPGVTAPRGEAAALPPLSPLRYLVQKVASELHPKVCNHGEGPY